MINTRNFSKRSKKTLTIFIILVLILASFLVYYFFIRNKTPEVRTLNQNTKGQVTETNNGVQVSSGDSPGTNTKNSAVGGGSTTLLAPSGNFVSDHNPNLSGSPSPSSMTSVCNTTSGATCKISFTSISNGVTKSLPSQVTDSGGSAYWNWTLQNTGLTQGTWTIQATSTLGGQTKTSSDAMNLVVSQ